MKEAWILYRSSNHATVSSTTFLNASRCMLFANPADKTRRANLVVGTYCIVRRTPRFPTFHVKMCVYIYIYTTRDFAMCMHVYIKIRTSALHRVAKRDLSVCIAKKTTQKFHKFLKHPRKGGLFRRHRRRREERKRREAGTVTRRKNNSFAL